MTFSHRTWKRTYKRNLNRDREQNNAETPKTSPVRRRSRRRDGVRDHVQLDPVGHRFDRLNLGFEGQQYVQQYGTKTLDHQATESVRWAPSPSKFEQVTPGA